MSRLKQLVEIIKRWLLSLRRRNISCAEFEGFILAYLEGNLSTRQQSIFEFHLQACPHCQNYLEAYRRAVAISKKVFEFPHAPVPKEVPEELIQAILRARAG
jgi:anti-sigma factor RsiW